MRIFLLDSAYRGNRLYSLKSKEKQYLTKVLRLSVGTVFSAKDRDENYYNAILLDQDTLSLERTNSPEENLLDSLSSYSGSFANIDMYIAILKGKKNEMVVRALTEIGVRKITFVQSTFVQEKDFSSHQRERLETIVREAVQQSGAKTPIIAGPIPFSQAILDASEQKTFILHQSSLEKTLSLKEATALLTINDSVSCFIGPEGGFSDEECSLAIENGATPVLLNTNILRAETAAIYTASALQTILQG